MSKSVTCRSSLTLFVVGVVAWALAVWPAQAQYVSTAVTGLNAPSGIAVDSSNNVYITDTFNNRIALYVPGAGTLTTFAGSGAPGTNDGVGLSASFDQPQGIVTVRGGVVVSDYGSSVIRYVTFDGTVTTLAGHPFVTGQANGPAASATFSFPAGIAVDNGRNLYVADSQNGVIREISAGNIVSTVATGGFSFSLPTAVAVDNNTNIWVADSFLNIICLISNGTVTVVGGASGQIGTNDSPIASSARFNSPSGLLWVPGNNYLLISDSGNDTIRRLFPTNHTGTASYAVQTVSGIPGQPGLANGARATAQFNQPVGLSVDPTDLGFYVADSGNNAVRVLLDSPPILQTLPASGVTLNSLTLNGTVIPEDASATYYFEWGLTTNFGFFTATNVVTSGSNSIQAVSAALPDLWPGPISAGTTYYFQLVATNSVGISYGGVVLVTTPPAPAQVVTLLATNITSTNATLQASVNPEGSATEVIFQWGSTTNLGNTTTPIILTNNSGGSQIVTYAISNLQPGTIYYYQALAFNSGGTVNGGLLVFNTLIIPPPTLSFSPSNGYYPDCVTVTVTSSSPSVFYTTDGSTPTNTSAQVTMTQTSTNAPFTGSIEWCNPQASLSSLQVIAFNGTSATLLPGGFPSTNLIGFPQPLSGGSGGELYVPVTVNMQSNTALKSLQLRVEINPNAGAPPVTSIALQPLTANDFVTLPGPAPSDAPVTFQTFPYATTGGGQGLLITAPGNGSGMNMGGFGAVVMLHFQIPSTATLGQTYSLNVLFPSGTSDGATNTVDFATLPAQTLTVTDPAYMVGDTTPSYGYNAGQFGQGALDNADVNNAIYASVGIRVPPSDSDVYNCMDAWPPDSAGRGGDGFIRLLDWETILARASGGVLIYPGLDTNNYLRFWASGDTGFPSHVVVDWEPGGPPVTLDAKSGADSPEAPAGKLAASNAPPGLVWFCQASVGSGTIANAVPGNTYSLPVYANVLPGYNLAALQFRTIITGSAGALPAVTSVQFTPANGVPAPLVLPGLSGNDKVQAWGFGSFAAPMQNSNYLGTVSFQVPPGATQGTSYALHFSGVDGAPGNAAYQLESHPGSVWVLSAAPQAASITSDEWKLAFFGSLTNSQAGDNVDADGDGAPNWQEYLAGTNPTNAQSCLQFSSAGLYTNGVRGVAINWLTAPGKNYLLQSSTSLTGAAWTPVSTNSGDGNNYQCIITNFSGNARFYQIRLQP